MLLDRRETRDWLRPGGPTCLRPDLTPHYTPHYTTPQYPSTHHTTPHHNTTLQLVYSCVRGQDAW
uniref:Uncharacterized protein n=1 Tax=Mesocestoides corti TaxID=53468 RepID=A0A5K3G049_MESCO